RLLIPAIAYISVKEKTVSPLSFLFDLIALAHIINTDVIRLNNVSRFIFTIEHQYWNVSRFYRIIGKRKIDGKRIPLPGMIQWEFGFFDQHFVQFHFII